GWNGYGQLGDGTTSDRAAPVAVSGFSNAAAVAAGEIHTVAFKSDASVWAWGNNGSGASGAAPSGQLCDGLASGSRATPAPAKWISTAQADFNGNSQSDILWHNTSTAATETCLRNGFSVTSSALIPSVADLNWSIVGVGDFDGDGKADILWRNAGSGFNAIWLMNGFTLQSSAMILSVAAPWMVGAVLDVDGDGKTDILWRDPVRGLTAIWQMDGLRLNTSYFIQSMPVAWAIGSAGDFDGDGRGDILWRNTNTGDNAIWLTSGFPTMPNSALIPA